jgi:tetratricopeptide (TPR) repeat protein
VMSPTLADRYHDLAEAMNARGSMELAVPFYRQAVALLLAERQQWRDAFPGQTPMPPALSSGESDEGLDELIEAAGLLSEPEAPAVASAVRSARAADPEAVRAELAELAADLTPDNAEQLLISLEAFEAHPLPSDVEAERLGLMGKALLMLGRREQARSRLEQALELDGERLDLAVNTAASQLAVGADAEALVLLRSWAKHCPPEAEAKQRTALLRNWITAEERCGDPEQARAARLALAAHDLSAASPEAWLSQALAWRSEGDHMHALQLLQLLRADGYSGSQLLEPLAELLEEQGDYRAAALVYRDLLKQPAPAPNQEG